MFHPLILGILSQIILCDRNIKLIQMKYICDRSLWILCDLAIQFRQVTLIYGYTILNHH